MSDEFNPYQSPSTPVGQWEGRTDLELVFADATQALAQTKPWARFLSVLGFLFFGLSIFALLFVFNLAGPAPVMFVAVVPFAVLFYLVPSLLLWSYASRIGHFLNDRSSSSLVGAVAAQKSFWRYVGITTAIIIVFYLGILMVGVILAVL